MSFAQLQCFLRHDQQKTTEVYAGHIAMGTRKQTDHLADFRQRKLLDSEALAPIKSSIRPVPQASIHNNYLNHWS